MKFILLVNDVSDLQPHQTTSLLGWQMSHAGHDVLVASIDGVMLKDGKIEVIGQKCATEDRLESWLELPHAEHWQNWDALWVRTNPARDPQRLQHHLWVLGLLTFDHRPVFNRPSALLAQIAKSNMILFPNPEQTLVTSRAAEILKQAESCTPLDGVLKPACGTRGEGVRRVQKLSQLPKKLSNPHIFQPFNPAVKGGDLRLVCSRGQPFQVQGTYLAIGRKAPEGSFVTNLHQGGEACLSTPTAEQLGIATKVAGDLYNRGISLAGLDFIGTQLIEANVFATGGVVPFQRLTGFDAIGPLLEDLLLEL